MQGALAGIHSLQTLQCRCIARSEATVSHVAVPVGTMAAWGKCAACFPCLALTLLLLICSLLHGSSTAAGGSSLTAQGLAVSKAALAAERAAAAGPALQHQRQAARSSACRDVRSKSPGGPKQQGAPRRRRPASASFAGPSALPERASRCTSFCGKACALWFGCVPQQSTVHFVLSKLTCAQI